MERKRAVCCHRPRRGTSRKKSNYVSSKLLVFPFNAALAPSPFNVSSTLSFIIGSFGAEIGSSGAGVVPKPGRFLLRLSVWRVLMREYQTLRGPDDISVNEPQQAALHSQHLAYMIKWTEEPVDDDIEPSST